MPLREIFSARRRRARRGEVRLDNEVNILNPPLPARFRAWAVDSAIAAIYLFVALGVTFGVTTDGGPAFRSISVLWFFALISAAALVVRRRMPVITLAVTIGVAVFSFPSGLGASVFPLLLALYTVAAYRSARGGWLAFAAVLIGFGVAATVMALLGSGSQTLTVESVVFGLLALVAVLSGVTVGTRRRYVAALQDRAAHLLRDRDLLARIAVSAERTRIAREMHDIVSHSLTVMVTLTEGSAAQVASAPERAALAMRQAADTGRHALADMRRMLGVLDDQSDSNPSYAPPPNMDAIPALVQQMRDAELPVRLTVTGKFTEDPARELTVYRIVQESMTNILRHAPLAPAVSVTVTHTEDQTLITVDNGPAMPSAATEVSPPLTTGGRGLIGIRARAELYGGRMAAGSKPGGGWHLEVSLPNNAGELATAPMTGPNTEDSL